jgi:hypothetical protein
MAELQGEVARDPLLDREKVYRRVLPGSYKNEPDGTRRLSSQAFSDRSMRPSVDRARLCTPQFTQQDPTNGVVSVLVSQIRENEIWQYDSKQRPIGAYRADVIPDPLPENLAHCVIVLRPDQANDRIFRKLLERLAKVAEPVLAPSDP